MTGFERAPQPENTPEERQVTSRHTASHEGILYNVYDLIEKSESLPAEDVPIELFESLKENKYWIDEKEKWLGPSDILTLAEEHQKNWNAMVQTKPDWKKHIESVRDAEYEKYPLLLIGERDVIDGMHRLTRAWIDDVKELRIKRFEQLPSEAAIGKSPYNPSV